MKLQMAMQALQQGNRQQAEALLRQALGEEPNNVHALYLLGDLYRSFQRPDQAIPLLRRAIECNDKLVPAYFHLARMLASMGRDEEMAPLLARLDELVSGDYQNLLQLGLLYHELAYYTQAENALRQAIELQPRRADARTNLAALLRDVGRLDDAMATIREALALDPDCVLAYAVMKYVKTFSAGDADIAAMQALYARLDGAPQHKVELAYALGKASEDCGDYSRAFDYFDAANKLARQQNPYNRDSYIQFFPALKQQFSEAFFRSHQAPPGERGAPIFVLGMPRSGTSLVEQILASHHQVFGAGELGAIAEVSTHTQFMTNKHFPASVAGLSQQQLQTLAGEYLRQLYRHAGDSRFAVDKLPHNFIFIGFIKMLFPEARIVHCVRNALDTCLSIYRNVFKGNHPYANDLADLGEYYCHYLDLMAHWHAAFPFQIYDIEYEELVAQPEVEIRALLNYCRLPFDENCLNFHETRRPVATASAAQVRKPMSGASVAQWERYRERLQPLIASLPAA